MLLARWHLPRLLGCRHYRDVPDAGLAWSCSIIAQRRRVERGEQTVALVAQLDRRGNVTRVETVDRYRGEIDEPVELPGWRL
jgi:hypothetical protein